MAITKNELLQDKILEALSIAKDITDASEIAGVSRKTIYAYFSDESFILKYRDLRREKMRDISIILNFIASQASNNIYSILSNESLSPQALLNASIKILELFLKFGQLENELNKVQLEENSFGFFSTNKK